MSSSGRVVDERCTLNRCTESDDLVRVHALAGIALEELGDALLHLWHAGHSADEDDVFDLVLVETCFAERELANLNGAVDEVGRELLERRSGEQTLKVERFVASARNDERQVDLGLGDRGELALRLFGRRP